MDNKTNENRPQNDIAHGLNSPELRNNRNIPFVDDTIEQNNGNEPVRPRRLKDETANRDPPTPKEDRKLHAADLGAIHQSPNSDTIVVDTPEGTLYITLDPDSAKSNKLTSPNFSALPSPSTETTDISSPTTSKAFGAEDSKVMIENEKEIEMEHRRASLRRNSISMPTLQNLEVMREQYYERIPEHHQSSVSGFSDGDNTADENGVLSDDEPTKSPLRSPRRKSTAPRRFGRSEFSMDDDDYSPSHSVTSVNSLASLLREKLQSIPQKMRKKPTDYKLRAFVALMFLAVVFFVAFAYVLYHQQAATKAYFDNVQWNEPKRLLRIFNADDVEIFKARLAVGLQGKTKAYPCLPEHRRSDGSECLEWLNTLRFYLKSQLHDPEVDNTTCYNVHWKALRHDVTPNDCFDWGDTKVHWYGGAQSLNLTWPLDAGSIDYTPFITGDIKKSQFGNVLRRYFINSKGAAVIVDDETPLLFASNKGKKEICIKSKFDNFAFANKLTEFPEMRYNICTSTDMNSLHASIHDHQKEPLWHATKKVYMENLDSLLSDPVWEIAPRFKHELNDEMIVKYSEDVLNLGFKVGHVLINEFWQNEIGDLEVDTTRFKQLNTTVDKIQRRGFIVVFTVQPFISTASKNFAECVQKRLLVTVKNSDKRIPALTRFKSLSSAGILDITNDRAVQWLVDKLHAVVKAHKVGAFYLDIGKASDIPYYYDTEKQLVNPDQYITIFTKKAFESELNIIGLSSAVTLLKPPTFVSLPPFESTWEDLGRIVPTILTYGVSGYPFIMPGAVGGDIYWPGSEQFLPSPKGSVDVKKNVTQDNGVDLPEKELYTRWLQMATFLPVMKFTHLPSKYNDERVLEMAKNLTILRKKMVTNVLLTSKSVANNKGLPLIRPLWMMAGSDAALTVADEFAVGEDIIVAPMVHKGATTRDVYLPTGLWQDGIDGSLLKGNRWMHDYRVPLDRVAYFIRKPDDLRL